MSHFSVLVIGENLEEQMEKFNENRTVERYMKYTKAELIEKGKNKIEDYKNNTYKTYLENPEKYKSECSGNESHIKYLEEEFPLKLNWTDEQIYKEEISWYDSEDIDELGNVWSESNPFGKWDYYRAGGRWAGSIKLKDGIDKSKYDKPNFTWEWEKQDSDGVLKKNLVDSAYVEDIDFCIDRTSDSWRKACRYWEVVIDGSELKPDEKETDFMLLWNKEYFAAKYGNNKEEYADSILLFKTFAVVKDGQWFEPGKVGWWGCNSAAPEEERDFRNSFYDRFIKDLPQGTCLTVVDCHV